MTGLVHDALRRTQRAVELLGELVTAAKRIADAQERQANLLDEVATNLASLVEIAASRGPRL